MNEHNKCDGRHNNLLLSDRASRFVMTLLGTKQNMSQNYNKFDVNLLNTK